MKTVLQKIFTTLSLSFIISFAFAQAGTLDSSFGVNGKVTTSFTVASQLSDLAIQNDGKIIVAGTYSKSWDVFGFLLVRYNSNGAIDSSFGVNGTVITYFDTLPWLGVYGTSLVIQPDNKIVVGGNKSEIGLAYGNFAIARYLQNGSLDSSFGTNGKLVTDVDPNFNPEAGIASLALQNDGKILAGGFSDGYCLIRYYPNGRIDSTFGINGKVQNVGDFRYINEVVLQNNGKIITVGNNSLPNGETYSHQLEVNSLKTNGDSDSSFGNNGQVLLSFFDNDESSATSSAIVENNKILLSGYSYNPVLNKYALVLAKFDSSGGADASFGTDGKVVNSNLNTYAYPVGKLLVQQNGKILVTGGITNFELYRFNSNGSLDSSFGNNGIAMVNFGYTSQALSTALNSNGNIVLGGSPSISLARLKGDEPITISIKKSISITEGNTGTTPAPFKIVLNKPATTDVFVNYTTKNLNATAGSDYAAASGTLRIKAGKASGNIVVNVIGDNTVEPNERFTLVLSNPVNAILGTLDSATCTIKNDDPSFALNALSQENIKTAAVKIYPNPVKDILTIEGLHANAKTNISIINEAGKIIAVYTTTASLFAQNIKQLSPGSYFVKIESDNKTETLKFIKQ